MVFCTLFDSNYLDKGLALYKSMRKHMENFRLYVFVFDNKCFQILTDLRLKNVIVISVEAIMTETLRRLKVERTRAEFCWTCTPVVIEYVLSVCDEKICTYIDADIYFFASPLNILREIVDDGCSVGLVRHGFERDYNYGQWVFEVGKYCIEFNTFFNNEEGTQVLREWKQDCFRWCYYRREKGRLGDQKYADKWRMKYSCVHEVENLGAGVAPWNLHLYKYIGKRKGNIWMKYKDTEFQLIFYHFEGMKYLKDGSVYLNLWKPGGLENRKKIRLLYGEYFESINSIRKYLAKSYGINFEHMIIDKQTFSSGKDALKRFCISDGLFEGVKDWAGYKWNGFKKEKRGIQ